MKSIYVNKTEPFDKILFEYNKKRVQDGGGTAKLWRSDLAHFYQFHTQSNESVVSYILFVDCQIANVFLCL